MNVQTYNFYSLAPISSNIFQNTEWEVKMYINKTCGCVLTESGDIKATAQIKGLLIIMRGDVMVIDFCFLMMA